MDAFSRLWQGRKQAPAETKEMTSSPVDAIAQKKAGLQGGTALGTPAIHGASNFRGDSASQVPDQGLVEVDAMSMTTGTDEVNSSSLVSSDGTHNSSSTFVSSDTLYTGRESELDALAGRPYNNVIYGPPRPPNEAERAASAVELIQIMDAAPDAEIDNLLRLICDIFQSPASFIALFDDQRIFIRNTHGLFSRGDFPWRSSFCAWCLSPKEPEMIVIQDTHQDKRFCNNRFVLGEPNVRFYCGSPLLASNGHRLGTICFIDTKPRNFDAGSARLLNNFAELVVRQLEKDIALAMMKNQQAKRQTQEQPRQLFAQMLRALDACTSAIMLLDTSRPHWPMLHINHEAEELTGLYMDRGQNPSIKGCFRLPARSQCTWESYEDAMKNGDEVEVLGARFADDEDRAPVDLKFRPANRGAMDVNTLTAVVPSHVMMEQGQAGLYFVTITPHKQRPTAPTSPRKCVAGSSISYDQQIMTDHLPGLELGMLLGRGAHGAVYFGRWYGTQVAVKVLHRQAAGGATLEALLTQQLNHPHVVHTHRYAVVPYEKSLQGRHSQSAIMSTHGSDDTAWSMSSNSADGCALDLAAAAAGRPAAASTASVADSAMEEELLMDKELWQGGGNASDSSSGEEVWMVMDFCDRGTLEDAIDRGWLHQPALMLDTVMPGPKLDQVLVTAYEVASAMVYLHEKGVIHGDLTAANVLLTSSGADSGSGRGFVAKVADFGLAHDLGSAQSRIETNTYGSATHMPPELLKYGTLSRAADVYSFGVMMWMMYTGSRPWAGLTHAQVIHLVCLSKRKLQLPDSCPLAYKALVSRCMEYKAELRPTFCEVRAELESIIAQHQEWHSDHHMSGMSEQLREGTELDSWGAFTDEMRALTDAGVIQSF